MKEFAANEYAAMKEALSGIACEEINELKRSGQCYAAVLDSLNRLKDQVTGYSFADDAEEICFFKETAPKFLKELIYHAESYYLEANLPADDEDGQAAYYKHELERIRIFFERNRLLYNYYRSGQSHYDQLFFLRAAEVQHNMPDPFINLDPRFCTTHSYKLAKLQAYELLRERIRQSLRRTSGAPGNNDVTTARHKPENKWTDAKVFLIEFGYALYAKGCINNGTADVKLIMDTLEAAFNVSLGNYYAVYNQNIRLRKRSSRTQFLDELRDHLKRRMDDEDAYPG